MKKLKTYKPITPGQRHMVRINNDILWKGKPYKKLIIGKKQTGGRNNQGKITSYHRGSKIKNLYRLVSFKGSPEKEVYKIKRFEYDPNRSSYLALIENLNQKSKKPYLYTLATSQNQIGDLILTDPQAEIKIGNRLALKNIPLGTLIHNIELKVNKGGQVARAAGTYGQLINKDLKSNYALIRLNSSQEVKINLNCYATIGIVSNIYHNNRKLGKAGITRLLGKRPTVRGVAMNPIDHPHGGGEGKTSGGRPSVTPWGKLTKK